MRGLQHALVRAAGMLDTARHLQQEAAAAGLAPPSRFGAEVIARMLGLRYNHPSAADGLELRPGDTATRAEAAYSFAKLLRAERVDRAVRRVPRGGIRPPRADGVATANPRPRGLLRRFPVRLGRHVREDADPLRRHLARRLRLLRLCVAHLPSRALPGRGQLQKILRGRTASPMAGEVPASTRIARAALRPGDLIFFSEEGVDARPARSPTWASMRAGAGSSTRRARGRR